MLKRNLLISLFSLLLLPAVAQQSDTLYTFRFVPKHSVFYVPYRGNGAELERLLDSIAVRSREIAAGQMYLGVSSYAPQATPTVSAARMGYLQCSRVKSELILRGGIAERNFVTDQMFSDPFGDTLRNVVVVTFPAGVERVARIAGSEAAAKVEAYLAEVAADSPEARQAAEAARAAALRAEQERKKQQQEIERQAQQRAQEAEAERISAEQAEAERQRLAVEEQARQQAQTTAKPYTLALRTNLLRWATLTPDLGVEWRITRHWAVAVDGSWTAWSWDNRDRRYALWKISPAIHYYIGKQKRGYVGVMYHTGQFNYKLSDTGKQGDQQGGGIVGGYRLPIGKCLMLDFNLGVGCTHAEYEKYTVIDGVRVRQGNGVKNYWGINQAGVTLVWKLF